RLDRGPSIRRRCASVTSGATLSFTTGGNGHWVPARGRGQRVERWERISSAGVQAPCRQGSRATTLSVVPDLIRDPVSSALAMRREAPPWLEPDLLRRLDPSFDGVTRDVGRRLGDYPPASSRARAMPPTTIRHHAN